MPVIRAGDADDVHFLQVEDTAVVLGDMGLVVGAEAALLGRRIQPAATIPLDLRIPRARSWPTSWLAVGP